MSRGILVDFKPGQIVPRSGVYRVYHDSHRLMHEAALLVNELFPCCRQCGDQVKFELLRSLRDNDVLPFHSGEILEVYDPPKKRGKIAG
jgi:hypothetical protein